MEKKQKMQQRILVGLFLLLLIAPMAVYPAVKNHIDSENRENRELVTFAEVLEAPVSYKPRAFNEFFNDHLPFKNQLVALNSLVSMRLFRTTSSPLVFVGEDNWLFFNNVGEDNPIDDILGANAYTEADHKKAADNIERRREELAARDIEFHVMIIPNKESVYTEYLPEYIRENAVEETRTDGLMAYLRQSGVEVTYPKQQLNDAKADYRVYYKYDTHWNNLGAYIGTAGLFEKIGIDLPPLERYTITTGAAIKDLADLAGIGAFCKDDLAYWTEEYGAGVTHTSDQIAKGHIRYTSDAADKRTVLVIGDSYFGAMQPFFYLQFGEVIEINRNVADYDPEELIALYEPDIVVLELVERASSILLHDDVLK